MHIFSLSLLHFTNQMHQAIHFIFTGDNSSSTDDSTDLHEPVVTGKKRVKSSKGAAKKRKGVVSADSSGYWSINLCNQVTCI